MKMRFLPALLAVFLFIPSVVFALGEEPEIRVKISGSLSEVTITSSQGFTLYQQVDGKRLQPLKVVPSFTSLRIWANNNTLSFSGSEAYYPGPFIIRSQNTDPSEVPQIKVNRTWYRGEFYIYKKKDSRALLIVNHLPLDDYLKGVVAVEMPPEWPIEALKAQAIAARTYAYSQMKEPLSQRYDICATQECQVYRGVGGEVAVTNRAIDETLGEVITYQGKPIQAFFHSSSGGVTENSQDLLGESIPYLSSVEDFDQNSPHRIWERKYSSSALRERLADYGVQVGTLKEIKVVATTSTGRAKTLKIIGSKGSAKMSAMTFQKMLGLKSVFFSIKNSGSSLAAGGYVFQKAAHTDEGENIFDDSRGKNFIIVGKGFGHGLGMSQWGARAMAENGHTYREIIQHYYPNSYLENINW